MAGKLMSCPKCEGWITVPEIPQAQPPSRLKRDAVATDTQRISSASQTGPTKRGFFESAKKSWSLVDCLTSNVVKIDKFPFELGSSEAVDLRLDDGVANYCALVETKNNSICLALRDPAAQVILNGIAVEKSTQLSLETDYSLHVGSHFFILRGGRHIEKWTEGLNLQQWHLHQPQTDSTSGPMELAALGKLVASRNYDPTATVI
jgi:hypothetical protein